MAWTPLEKRIEEAKKKGEEYLPLILAGPILRKVTKESVTVWFVLKEGVLATLYLYDGQTKIGSTSHNGIQLGNFVFVYALTVKTNLQSNRNYHYEIEFEGNPSLSQMELSFSYESGESRPSFSLPPSNLNNLRIIHGSCRHPHGQGRDALEALDVMLDNKKGGTTNALERPHQLFLTGDQIYADDVADGLLFMIVDAAKVLFGWDEPLPKDIILDHGARSVKKLGLSSDFSKSHLYKFQEYCLMYIMVWSETLWPKEEVDFPSFKILYGQEFSFENRYETETNNIKIFKQTLPAIRKALANVPTYMMFDDHDVTDDWNVNWHWCKDLYSNPLGRQVVRNALSAYALFQGVGNTPEQFEQTNGKDFLEKIDGHLKTIDSSFNPYLNISLIGKNEKGTTRPYEDKSLNWHFRISFDQFELIALDTRTLREYPPQSDTEFCGLINKKGFELQLPEENSIEKEIVIVISPAPVIGVPLVEFFQKFRLKKEISYEQTTSRDTEAWQLNQVTFNRLIARLSSILKVNNNKRTGQFLFLSGDVHYGFAAKYQLWADQLFENKKLQNSNNNISNQICFAQLTSSPQKNENDGTLILHNGGYLPLINKLPKPIEKGGWNNELGKKTIVGYYKIESSASYEGKIFYGNTGTESLIEVDEKQLTLSNNDKLILTVPPHWIVKTDFILAEKATEKIPKIRKPEPILVNQTVLQKAISSYQTAKMQKEIAIDYIKYADKWGNGKEIVGTNNLGEIRIEGLENERVAVQNLWWKLGDDKGDALQIHPLSVFKVPLSMDKDKPKFNIES